MSRLLLAAAAFTAALAGPVAAEPQTPLQTSFDSAVVEAGFVARDPVARFTASGEYAGISDPDFPILVANAQESGDWTPLLPPSISEMALVASN